MSIRPVTSPRPPALSQSELQRYREDGYIVPDFRFSPAAVRRMGAELMRLNDAIPDLGTMALTNPHLRPSPVDGRYGALLPYCLDPGLLDTVEAIDGPDVLLWTTDLFHRPAGHGVATPWHQDDEYWPIEPMGGTSAWIAITPCRKGNGCLRVIPGSHKRRASHQVAESGAFPRNLDPDTFDEADAVDVELEPGQMMLFHALLVHGSWPNTSSQPRTGMTMRFIPSTSFFDHDAGSENAGQAYWTGYALYLARGFNRCDRNDLIRNKPPAA